MENVKKHIEHWRNGADEAIETAEILLSKKKIAFGLFFCHFAIEKQLKSQFIFHNNDFPPKTHNLLYFTKNIGIEITDDIKLFFSELMAFKIEGRYPELTIPIPDYKKAKYILKTSKETLEWLRKK